MCEDFIDDGGLDWVDWMIIGPMAEEIAEEKRKRDEIEREHDASDEDYWNIINRP